MSQKTSKTTVESVAWDSKRRYKVGMNVTHSSQVWVNTTGGNSEPGVGSDWFGLGVSGSAFVSKHPPIQVGSQVSVIVLDNNDHPDFIELHEDGMYRIEDEFYTYTKGSGATNSEITILNGRTIQSGSIINLLKFYS